MQYDKDTQVIVSQLVNEFYTQFLFKIESLLQDLVFLLDITATFFQQFASKCERFIDIRICLDSPKAANWNQSPGKIYAHFVHKFGSGSIK